MNYGVATAIYFSLKLERFWLSLYKVNIVIFGDEFVSLYKCFLEKHDFTFICFSFRKSKFIISLCNHTSI